MPPIAPPPVAEIVPDRVCVPGGLAVPVAGLGAVDPLLHEGRTTIVSRKAIRTKSVSVTRCLLSEAARKDAMSGKMSWPASPLFIELNASKQSRNLEWYDPPNAGSRSIEPWKEKPFLTRIL